MRKVRGLSTLGPEVNFRPAGWFFHRGNVILELKSLGRESVRHGSSFQTSTVFHGRRKEEMRVGVGILCLPGLWIEAPRFCPSPQDSLMEGRKEAQLMIVTHHLCALSRSLSSLVLNGHLCELGKLDGASSLPTLREWFRNSVMGPQC